MLRCLEPSDLQGIGNSMVADFERKIALIPKEMCAPFHHEARQLETQLLTVYQMVAQMTRNVDDLDQIASLWERVVLMCDAFAERLSALVKQHPQCGAGSYYDRVLDLRNKCLRLQTMHA